MTPSTVNPSNQTTSPRESCTETVSSARLLRPIAPRTRQASNSFEAEPPEGSRTIVYPDVRTSTYNHAHDTPTLTSTATEPRVSYAQSPRPSGTQHDYDTSLLPAHDGRTPQGLRSAGKRRRGISQSRDTIDSEDEFTPTRKRARTVGSRTGGGGQNGEARGPGSIGSMPWDTPQVAINRTFM